MHCLLLLLLTAPVLTSAGGLGAILSKPLYQQLFPQALPVYQYDNLLEMAATYPAFANTGNDAVDKREVAAFLGQVALETGDLRYVEEINKGDYCQPSAEYPCAPGKQYYGRGAIQLSWNYNYKDFGKAIGVDLVAQPDLVASRPDLVWRSALWYWNTDKWNGNIHDVVGQPGGFAYTTYLINGGLECGVNPPNRDSEKMRIANFPPDARGDDAVANSYTYIASSTDDDHTPPCNEHACADTPEADIGPDQCTPTFVMRFSHWTVHQLQLQ
ncbi:chitinase [Achlya hypogyna]|uniref:Chitinase n=1 Tax=Achlya hypogyna TaxID=1202772 RepID=A0A1V9YPF9_ACHHY|nr:chitinase [Achlya hypogyna]